MRIPLSLAFGGAGLPLALSAWFGFAAPSAIEVANSVLSQHPVLDSHIDLPVQLRVRFGGDLANSSANYLGRLPLHVDLPRLRQGKSGGFFSIAWVPCAALLGIEDGDNFSNPTPQVRDTLEQVDMTYQLAARYPKDVAVATTPTEVRRAWKHGQLAHLIGIEGAHSLGNSLATLRMFARLGVRYLTLTHTCHNAFADSAGWTTGEELPPLHGGLSELGKRLLKELNRLGVMADLSHTSDDTARDVVRLSKAPPFFSHSGARSIAKHVRNLPDDILESLQGRDAIVMVPFLFDFVGPNADVALVADHVEYIALKMGSRSKVGIGSDFDGTSHVAAGLDSVADYPKLFAELYERGWSRRELAGLASENFLRIFQTTLDVAAKIDEVIGDMVPWDKREDLHAGTGWF